MELVGNREDAALAGRELSISQEWWSFFGEQLAVGAVIRSEENDVWTIADLAHLIETKVQPRLGGELPRRHVDLSSHDTVAVGSSDVLFAEFC